MRAVAINKHEQKTTERHAVEHKRQEADPPKQVHQEGDRHNAGDECETRD
jgi:hypothetical protein